MKSINLKMKYRKYNADKRLCSKYLIFNYIIVLSIFSILLFLYGFFPMNYNDNTIATKRDIPKFIDRTRIKIDEVYRPVVKKIILIVIDALRWDFVTGVNGRRAMPVTNRLLSNSAGCIYKTKVNSPTVTMPRIKAMTTGSIPNFIDVAVNLGAHQISGDSILKQLKNHGHRIIFYGDDTWLKLFGNLFYRYEGITSFYVNDYTEVDYNVTRNVAVELDRKDWSVMILHYLGLDHIGHISGPFSPLIKKKLNQMDEIIGTIESYVSNWNKNDEPTLFLVCGDHGMKNSGGHGGATLEESLVPLLAFGRSCTNKDKLDDEIAQIDIVPTLSVLLGVPIPSGNLGTAVLNMMSELTFSQKLFALYYNAEQLLLRYQQITGYQYTAAYKTYQDAIKLHSVWLNTHSNINEMVYDIILMYETAIQEMKDTLSNSLLKYDVGTMSLAIVFMGHILYICLSSEKSSFTSYKQFLSVFVTSYIGWMFLNYLFDAESKTALLSYNLDLHFIFVNIPIFSIFILNCYLCSSRIVSLNKISGLTMLQILLPIGTLIHTLSLGSSSFIEEEHQTWYFFWITLVTYFAYNEVQKNEKNKFTNLTISLILVMVGHRVLRKLNSTGDKYAHLPDISGWLLNQDSSLGITLLLIFGLVLLVWLDFTYEEVEHRSITVFLDTFIAILIYLRHGIANAVFIPDFYFDSRGIVEIHYFWAFTSIYVIHSLYRVTTIMRHAPYKHLSLPLFLLLKKWVILSCLLHRPYNVILLPIQLMVGIVIYELTKNKDNSDIKIYLYLWSSNTFYFYQGNSNSLATIDVAAGYVGLETYRPVVTGIFLTINTYSTQILGFLMYLCDCTLQDSFLTSEAMLSLCKQYAFWRLVPLTFYIIITSYHRYHLFVWSVFSPKLLYEAMHCTVLFSVMFLLQLDFIFCDWRRAQKKVM